MLRKFTEELAQNLLVETTNVLELDIEPTSPIPLYFSLDGYSYQQQGAIKKLLLRDIQRKGIQQELDDVRFDELLRNRHIRLIVLLDAFDEYLLNK